MDKHEGERVGLFDTTLSEFDYLEMAQHESTITPEGFARTVARVTGAARLGSKPAATPARPAVLSKRPSVAEQRPAAPSRPAPAAKRDWIVDELDDASVSYKDMRGSGGCLWVVDGKAAKGAIEKLNSRGAGFALSQRGSKVTKHRPAWWTKGYPAEVETKPQAQKPQVGKAELESLEPGDTVFHKSFGYGRIVDIDGGYVDVRFDNDSKKRGARKFAFPGAFYQGLLRIG